ncbi:MAG TPA: D-erythronate dehydrogenase [Pararhizobium sp.]|uniref:D-erythronate dehydrogenase n=1 Tax=Pararhizobium sp. TaxID=1977563 RepID=UPI002B55F2D3|nr:D-erythronate dehydrogenase [Pararhizobium sp.]HTO30952.1 D-erythronate dehydrogenase [Pararhizobium sp.]
MHVLIIGAAGMIGRKLAARIAADGKLSDQPVDKLTLADIFPPGIPAGFLGEVTTEIVDLSEAGRAKTLIAQRPDVIFHLAAIVSGEAEIDFAKGYRINLDGSRLLFEAIRAESEANGYFPRLVFCSSLAVFGPPFASPITDEFLTAPTTSYGTQKAITEMLLADYSRRGIFDGVGIRLPTICIRPGKPNAAASGFFSNILREPLVGQEAILPVADTVRHWFASPRSAVGFLLHGASIDLSGLGVRRNLIMPGLSATVADQIEALRDVAGENAITLIRRVPDERIKMIVDGWAFDYAPALALSMGFRAESTMAEIIRIYVEDELGVP